MGSDNRFSSVAFTQFLDFIGEKGLVNPSKARNWRAASQQFLSILDESEKKDLRTIDIDHVIERFGHLKSTKVTGSSLKVYGSRFRGAINDFIAWAEDPVNYRHSGRSNKKKGEGSSKKTKQTQSKSPNSRLVERQDPEQPIRSATVESKVVVFPIPISDGRIVTIHNLPYELSPTDAEKISAVVKALAMTEP